ncbi:sulfite exporter TauE/SafE family protein [Striga asiatica]|uniref:Sulfite exporter TauE/SafE family protein n=1 Tax=Striga asiatica TaxID=4170 RepID=A0A5A7QNJ3_STRAF|nr:sulfite exporter TauE/SafE family protein [Striga asiatica]
MRSGAASSSTGKSEVKLLLLLPFSSPLLLMLLSAIYMSESRRAQDITNGVANNYPILENTCYSNSNCPSSTDHQENREVQQQCAYGIREENPEIELNLHHFHPRLLQKIPRDEQERKTALERRRRSYIEILAGIALLIGYYTTVGPEMAERHNAMMSRYIDSKPFLPQPTATSNKIFFLNSSVVGAQNYDEAFVFSALCLFNPALGRVNFVTLWSASSQRLPRNSTPVDQR